MSHALWPQRLQPSRLLCPSLFPGVGANPCPLRWWCYLTTSSSTTYFSSCPQSFSASRSFPVSHLFTSGSQSVGAWASKSVLPMNVKGQFPLRLTGLISLQSKGISRVFSSISLKASILWGLAFLMVQFSHPYMTAGKTIQNFVSKMKFLVFNILSRFVTLTQGDK